MPRQWTKRIWNDMQEVWLQRKYDQVSVKYWPINWGIGQLLVNILTHYWLICWSSCRPSLCRLWVDIQRTLGRLMSTNIYWLILQRTEILILVIWNVRLRIAEMHTAHSHLKCKNVCYVCFPFQVINASPLRNFCQFSFQLEEKHQLTLPLKVL